MLAKELLATILERIRRLGGNAGNSSNRPFLSGLLEQLLRRQVLVPRGLPVLRSVDHMRCTRSPVGVDPESALRIGVGRPVLEVGLPRQTQSV